MIGHLHADRDQIDIGMSRHLRRVRERQPGTITLGSCLGALLPRRAYRHDLEPR
jgi:hypothetical protein